MSRSVILGLNAFHGDASAALLIDGSLVAAVEEERFNRVKHWAGFPAASIRYCLESSGVDPSEIGHVAISFDPRANLARRIGFALANRPSLTTLANRFRRGLKAAGIQDQLAAALALQAKDLRCRIHHIEHHRTHLATAFLAGPWEDAALLSVDGMGDFVSTMSAVGKDRNWKALNRVFYPHSLGFLYNALTLYLGFPHYGDEYKVMGLAPYGKPEFVDALRKVIHPLNDGFALNLDYFDHHKKGINMQWENGAPSVAPFHSPLLQKLLGPARKAGEECTSRHENIAHSLQVVTEEILLHLIRRLHDRSGNSRLCLAGGVAMNSVANGKILRETPFEELFVPAGAADNGTSIGAALAVWNQVLDRPRRFVQTHAATGSAFTDEACRTAAEAGAGEGYHVESFEREALLDFVTDCILAGKVVGWFQGRMEFGARALGHRSLLADPRRTDMRDIINLKIKFREKFRPFAPSILEEHVAEWFDPAEPSPFMERVLPIRPHRHSEIPAVTHVDGSGRLQTVSRSTNPLYYDLIDRFRQQTGVPLLLNTSLNENEPIVRTPEQAIDCFRRTAMDLIVVGKTVVSRC